MSNERLLRLRKNTFSSIVLQITSVICGFIIPQMILKAYGSNQNGLINSISQFLSMITFLEFGLGAVIQSSLYKPLAENDVQQISRIVVSSQKFFNKLAFILILYIVVLVFIYPIIVNDQFEWWYCTVMILVLSSGLLVQYFLGIVNRLLLTADQRGYISNNIHTVTIILNTIACYILIQYKVSLLILKFVTAFIFIIRPLFLMLYVKSYYKIDYQIKYDEEPIKQKWNGVAQHISAVVQESANLIILTFFSTLTNVSIYSIYNIVILGVKQLFMSTTTGIQALLGELLAKKEWDQLSNYFSWTEWSIHTATTYVFSLTGILIIPFMQVYTKGITDANYIQPVFSSLIISAHAFHCYRLPYNLMILAGGHFKQTQSCYIIAAILNILISIIAVKLFGLSGVGIGSVVALLFQICWMIYYNNKYFIKRSFTYVLKQFMVNVLTVFVALIIYYYSKFEILSYSTWLILAVKESILLLLFSLVINYVFYRNKLLQLIHFFRLR